MLLTKAARVNGKGKVYMKKKIFSVFSIIIEVICIGLGCKLLYSFAIIRDEYNIGIISDEYNISDSILYCNEIILALLVILLCITVVQLVMSFKK